VRLLILGGTGMLGHKLWQVLARQFAVYTTLRHGFDSYVRYNLFERRQTVDSVTAQDLDSITRAVVAVRPQVVVNCIGIVKQVAAAQDLLDSIAVNALFPHRLAQVCLAGGVRLIHISTDGVFSGRKGNYAEGDLADAEDLYGRTKFLGEVSYEGCLTLRTSMIGRELHTSHGLLEWFLGQEGKPIRGYTRAIFSGFTTNALAEIIAQIIVEHPHMHGVWHVASEPINKCNLLSLVQQIYGLKVHIEPDETVVYDRSLNADRFCQATGFVPPTWPAMIEQMYHDPTPYAALRGSYAH